MITDVLTTYNIPDCSVVDYTDGNKVFGAGHLLLSLMQRTAPYRTRDVAPAPLSAVVKEAKHWVDGGEGMAFHRPASMKFLNRWYTHVFNAKVKGDRQISDSALLGVISARLSRRDPLYFDRPLLWYSSTLDRWMKLCAGSAEFADMTLDEALSIATSLIDNDLIAFVPDQDAFKHRLAADYASRLDDIDAGDADTLRAAFHFVRTARYRYIAADCAAHLELHLLRQLSRNPNLDPNDRQAYGLDLDYLLAPSLD